MNVDVLLLTSRIYPYHWQFSCHMVWPQAKRGQGCGKTITNQAGAHDDNDDADADDADDNNDDDDGDDDDDDNDQDDDDDDDDDGEKAYNET